MDAKKIDAKFWEDFDKKVTCTLVPRFSDDIVRPCAAEDFQDYTSDLENRLRHVISALNDLLNNKTQWTTKTKKHLIKVLVIIGEQHRVSPWNTASCVELSLELIPKACLIFEKQSIAEILGGDDTFLSLVMFLRPRLLKDTWKSYPAAVACYKWLLQSMEKPLLKRYLTDVLPTALIIFDDYVPDNQAFGLSCISTIIEHCQNSRSLKNLNYDEVIYQALEKAMYKLTPDMIIPLYSCLSNLLDNIEFCNDSNDEFGWTKRDDVLANLLNNMELQSEIKCRFAYAMSLKKFLTFAVSAKHTKRLARIVSEYCENVCDLNTTEIALDLIKSFISTYHSLNVNFYATVYTSLLKLCLELSCRENTDEIHKKACECISLINKLCPHLSQEVLDNNIIASVLNEP